MILVKLGDTAHPFDVLMVSSSDHVSPLTGATLTVTRSKNGAAFGAWAGSVAEIGSGVYKLTPAAGDVDTTGELAIHATATSGDPADLLRQVISFDPYDATKLGLTNLDATISSRSSLSSAQVENAAWNATASTHNTAGTTGAKLNSLSGASGSGAISHTITVTSGGNPVDGALVWITTDAAGVNTVASATTDALGHATVFLDAGTYYGWAQRGGINFVNGQAQVVA